jgi:hypothetical protein
MPEHRNLAAFARWWLSQPVSAALRPPLQPIARYADDGGSEVTCLCLYRDAPYQVEFFMTPSADGRRSFPAHRHPRVDSIECHITGDIAFSVNGQRVRTDLQIEEVDTRGVQILCGQLLRIRPRDWHGAEVGERGGAFLSIQRWPAGVMPTSVALDWEGPPHVSVNGLPAVTG